MGRLRVYLKTFDSTGAYDADFTEITDDVMSIGKVSQKLDNSEYDVGILRNSSMNLKIRNDQGTYSEAGARKSIFVFKRIDSIIKITWDGRLYPPKAGFFKAYSGVLGGETEVFKGLLTEVSSVSNIQEQSIDFTIQGFESLFSRVSVPYGSISNGDNISDVIYACLNQSAITDLLTVSLSNITPDNDYVIDDKSDLENKTVEEALKSGLLLSSNSVLYIENDIVYVTDRDAYSASVEYSFFGQASTSGIENIIDIKKYREGINRVFNFITWPETSLSSSDATSQETYGIRKKEVSTALISTGSTSKIQTVLDAVKTEFKDPKVEFEMTAPLNYGTVALKLRSRVDIDYPTIYRSADGNPIPRWGQVVWGSFQYPIGQWTLTIGTDKNFKVMGKSIDLLKETITFSLREI